MNTRTRGWLAVISMFSAILVLSCSKRGVEKQTYNSTGVVKTVDATRSTVTIDHRDIPGFMPAMEMEFPAANPTVIRGFASGDKVAFVLERTNGKVSLVGITKVAEAIPALNGEQLFASNCAECHGPKGEGAKKGISLLSGHALNHSEDEYEEQVIKGTPNKMPGFRDKFTDEQIATIVKYVRETIQKDSKKEVNNNHEHPQKP